MPKVHCLLVVGQGTMRRALVAFSILLLAPVALVMGFWYFDFSFGIGEAPPGTINTLLMIHCACGLAAIVWLAVAVRRRWGHILKDLKSTLGAICVLLAAASVLAWGFYLLVIPVYGMWYDLP